MLAMPWAKECHKNSTLPSGCKCSHSLVLELSRLSPNKTSSTKQVVVGQLWPRGARLPTPGPGGRTLNKNNAFPFPQDAFLQTGGNYRLATGYYLWSCGTFWNTTHSTKEMPPDQCFFHSHESRAAGRPALIAITSLPHGMPADSTKERRMISQTKLA